MNLVLTLFLKVGPGLVKATDLALPPRDTAAVAALRERFVSTWVTPGADFLLHLQLGRVRMF